MVQSDVEDAVGNGEAFLNGSRRWVNTCAGVVPSTSAGKRAAVSACHFSGLCLPSAWREARLALPMACSTSFTLCCLGVGRSHVPWSCCVGLDTLLPPCLGRIHCIAPLLAGSYPCCLQITSNYRSTTAPVPALTVRNGHSLLLWKASVTEAAPE